MTKDLNLDDDLSKIAGAGGLSDADATDSSGGTPNPVEKVIADDDGGGTADDGTQQGGAGTGGYSDPDLG